MPGAQRSCEPNVLGALEVAVRDLTLVLGAEVEVEVRLDETWGGVAVKGTYPGLQPTPKARSDISWDCGSASSQSKMFAVSLDVSVALLKSLGREQWNG